MRYCGRQVQGAAPAAGILVRKSGLLLGWFVLMAILVIGFGGESSAYGQCDCADPATTGVSEVECNALLALYTSTTGTGWSNNTNWNTTGTSVGSWYGVWGVGGQVTDLILNSNQLTDSIPTQLGNLTNLTRFYLNSNQLSGQIPASITNLTVLGSSWETDIGYNMLTATDPTVINFLTTKDPDRADTQTIPPESLNTTDITGNSIKLTWTPSPTPPMAVITGFIMPPHPAAPAW